MNFVREAAVKGMFYPDDPVKLQDEVESYVESAVVLGIEGDVIGIVSPHAGYVYSGGVAAYGYKAVAGGNYDTVIIIAPSHRMIFEGVALWDKGSFETPLGAIDIDEEIAALMVDKEGVIKLNREAHRGEHSLEVQLPFLQSVLEGIRIVPLIMGVQSVDMCRRLADNVFEAVKKTDKKVLIVGSTDLSHYYPYSEAVRLDSAVVERLGAFDIPGTVEDIEKGRAEACGSGPVIATMMLSEKMGANRGRVLRYANSGDVSGDKSAVVGYVSAVFYRERSYGGR